MAVRMISSCFNGGEVSPLLKARPDQTKYQNGCFKLKNFVCLPQGPATRRPGTLYLGEVGEDSIGNPVRLVPFVFSTTESRVLEAGAGYIRVWKDGQLIMDGDSPYEIETPYTVSDIPGLSFGQSADVVYIASANHHPAKLSRYADDDWRFEDIDFIPQTEIPTGLSISKTGTGQTRTYKYVVTAVDAETGEESLPSSTVSIKSDVLNTTDGKTITVSWSANSVEPLQYRVYKYDSGVFGFIGTVDGSVSSPSFEDTNIGADIDDTPPSADDPFTGPDEYPSIVFFWQQRLGWAASNNRPFTVWLSPSAQLESLASSSPPEDDDAIEATLATTQANRIQWVTSDRALVMGTTGNEWVIGSTDGDALTPDTMSFSFQGGRGSESIPPLSAGGSILFVQRGGRAVREFSYAYAEDKYNAPDLSIIAEHIFQNRTIVNWAYQLNPYSVVWAVLDDGTLAGLTYSREHEVVGWHVHETDGFVEDVCCVPGTDGYDRVWLIVRREINGEEKRYIELMGGYFIRQDDPSEAVFLDSSSLYDGDPTDSLAAFAPHLAGETVSVWADGSEQPETVVQEDGTVGLTKAASRVLVGLPYDSDLQPTRPEVDMSDGTTVSRIYKVSEVSLRLYKTSGILVGRNEDDLEEALMHDAADPEKPAFITGDVDVAIDTGWNEDWGLIVRAAGPAPATIMAVIYRVEIGGA